MDKTDLIEFTTYRFPNKKFLLDKQDLNEFRRVEGELLEKELELYDLIRNKELVKGGE